MHEVGICARCAFRGAFPEGRRLGQEDWWTSTEDLAGDSLLPTDRLGPGGGIVA